jgi:transposase
MAEFIIVGLDVHDKNMLMKIAADGATPDMRSFANSRDGRRALLSELRRRKDKADASRVVVAYEASGAGFGLHDDIVDAEFECHVLAPNRMSRSQKNRTLKTDERDAVMIFEHLRAHLLANNDLCDVWIPDHETRDDRELVRSRLNASEDLASLKGKVKNLLKRNGFRRSKNTGKGWTDSYRRWLLGLVRRKNGPLGVGTRRALQTHLRQMKMYEREVVTLDGYVAELAQSDRYRVQVEALVEELKGVGVHVAMVFLTEMGDLTRFSNRREIGSYIGLVPSSNESGENDNKKGHITHQGSWRLRKALCQAAWSRARTDEPERIVYQRICAKNPDKKKIAVVAIMRRLAIRMWHTALDVQSDPTRAAEGGRGPVSMEG